MEAVGVLALNAERRKAAGGALEALAARHHAMARAAAAGASQRDLAALAGLTGPEALARVAALLARPAMVELVAHYRRAA